MDVESEELGIQHFEANTELGYSDFSQVESSVMPFEEMKGKEGEHTPETDLSSPIQNHDLFYPR